MQRLCHRLQYSTIPDPVSSRLLLNSSMVLVSREINMNKSMFEHRTPFFRLLAKQNRLTMMRNAVWALSNLCRGKNPPPDFSKVISQDDT